MMSRWRRLLASCRRRLGLGRRRARRAALDQAMVEIASGLACYSAGAKDMHLRAAQAALRIVRPSTPVPATHPYIQPEYSESEPRCAVCGRDAAHPIHGASA